MDSHFTHLVWMSSPRTEGGLGKLDIPLLSDFTHTISKDYGVYLDKNGHTLRGLFIIDPKGILRYVVYVFPDSDSLTLSLAPSLTLDA